MFDQRQHRLQGTLCHKPNSFCFQSSLAQSQVHIINSLVSTCKIDVHCRGASSAHELQQANLPDSSHANVSQVSSCDVSRISCCDNLSMVKSALPSLHMHASPMSCDIHSCVNTNATASPKDHASAFVAHATCLLHVSTAKDLCHAAIQSPKADMIKLPFTQHGPKPSTALSLSAPTHPGQTPQPQAGHFTSGFTPLQQPEPLQHVFQLHEHQQEQQHQLEPWQQQQQLKQQHQQQQQLQQQLYLHLQQQQLAMGAAHQAVDVNGAQHLAAPASPAQQQQSRKRPRVSLCEGVGLVKLDLTDSPYTKKDSNERKALHRSDEAMQLKAKYATWPFKCLWPSAPMVNRHGARAPSHRAGPAQPLSGRATPTESARHSSAPTSRASSLVKSDTNAASHRHTATPSSRPDSSGNAARPTHKQAPKRIRVIGARADVIEELTSPVKLPSSLQAHAGAGTARDAAGRPGTAPGKADYMSHDVLISVAGWPGTAPGKADHMSHFVFINVAGRHISASGKADYMLGRLFTLHVTCAAVHRKCNVMIPCACPLSPCRLLTTTTDNFCR